MVMNWKKLTQLKTVKKKNGSGPLVWILVNVSTWMVKKKKDHGVKIEEDESLLEEEDWSSGQQEEWRQDLDFKRPKVVSVPI